jgi:choline-sulfatase
MIDYADAQLGQLLETLRRTGAADDTVVVVTSDHGDMLGERGLWYKMTFFERAMRVPLLLHAPRLLKPQRIGAPVSLVDLLPTLMEIAGQTESFEPAQSLDGHSLLPAAMGRGKPEGVVPGEFMAEGTTEPIFMIRRGRYKYVASAGDPPMLFDLSKDPSELHNLAGSGAAARIEAGFAKELADRWNSRELRQRILDSQRGRRVVHEALMTGRIAAWDFQPQTDAATEYYRNYGHPDFERALRIPAAGPPPGRRN